MEAALASAERQIERLRSRERAHARALLEARHQLQEASSASSVISEDASLTPEAGAPARRPLQRGLTPPQSFVTASVASVADHGMKAAECKPAQTRTATRALGTICSESVGHAKLDLSSAQDVCHTIWIPCLCQGPHWVGSTCSIKDHGLWSGTRSGLCTLLTARG